MTSVRWLTPLSPDRSGGGGHIRQAHLLAALARHAEIDLVSARAVTDPMVLALTRSVVTLDVTEADPSAQGRTARRLGDLWKALGPGPPREVATFVPVRRALRGYLGGGVDAVVVEYAGLAPLVRDRDGSPRDRPRWVLTLHNLGSQMAAQEAAVTAGRRQRWLYQRDARRACRWERELLEHYDRVVTVSEDDRQALVGPLPRRPGTPVVVVPNGVDLDAFRPSPRPAGPELIFTGTLSTAPNVDGARWAATEILPVIRRDHPSARLRIVGASPPPEVRALAALPGVEVHADVEAVAPWLAVAAVALVPLRIGSGTRLKALEALAAGRPVVGTSIGLGGLGLVHGRHALMADDAESLAGAVGRLLGDPALAERLAIAGRCLVEERFGWGPIGEGFVQAVLG